MGLAGNEELVVYLNRDEDPEPLEAAFPDYAVLLRVDRSDRADELRTLLEGIPALHFPRANRRDGRILTAHSRRGASAAADCVAPVSS